jgi:hypothetical protein
MPWSANQYGWKMAGLKCPTTTAAVPCAVESLPSTLRTLCRQGCSTRAQEFGTRPRPGSRDSSHARVRQHLAASPLGVELSPVDARRDELTEVPRRHSDRRTTRVAPSAERRRLVGPPAPSERTLDR